jgi:hypothetical protein
MAKKNTEYRSRNSESACGGLTPEFLLFTGFISHSLAP